jgi:hypothetical protein
LCSGDDDDDGRGTKYESVERRVSIRMGSEPSLPGVRGPRPELAEDEAVRMPPDEPELESYLSGDGLPFTSRLPCRLGRSWPVW